MLTLKNIFLSVKYQLLLILLVVLAYWPISSGQYFFTYDMVDCWLPWRHFIAQHIKSGEFPLWNPYQACGVPIYADLQGPLWSPESFLTSLFFTHTTKALSFLYIMYLCVAACGMFAVIKHFNTADKFAFVGAASFALSGFFYGHSQHFYAIISGAWFPWMFLFAIQFFKTSSYRSVFKLLLVVFMTTTTGNPAFTIMSIYILAIMFCYYIYTHLKSHDFILVKKIFKHLCLLGLVAILLHTVLIVSAYQAFDFISRNKGLTVDQATKNAFTIQSYLSYLCPLPSYADTDFYHTDRSMSNSYFGFIMLISLVLVCVRIKFSSIEKWLLGISLFFAITSMGKDFHVFIWVHHWLPGADKFRFPAYYQFFTMFILVLITSIHLKEIWSELYRRFWQKIAILLSVLLSILLIYIFFNFHLSSMLSLSQFLTSLSMPNALFINVFVIWFISLFAFITIRYSNISVEKLLVSIVVIDSIATVNICFKHSSLGNCRQPDIVQAIENCPKTQTHKYHVSNTHDQNNGVACLWRNTNIYKQQVSADYFNSFELDSFVKFTSFYPIQSKEMLNHPLLYILHQNQDSFSIIKDIKIQNNEITATAKLTQPSELVLLQNYFPGWSCYINGQMHDISQEYCFMKVKVSAGVHSLRFVFEPQFIYISALISYAAFFIIIIGLLFYGYRNRTSNRINL
jgi:hypothetical protein